MKRATSTCRQRKCSCDQCGYTVRVTRSWMAEGLPICPRHGEMLPSSPADLAFIGRIGPDDMPARDWTVICRENGWDDAILRKGKAAQSFYLREIREGGLEDRIRRARAAHCSYAGCGRWISDGADRCSAGHAQHEHAAELEACPF